MTAITPESLDLSILPAIPLTQKEQLPECAAIYFAIDLQSQIQYIGQTKNLRQRWVQHHRYPVLSQSSDVKIAWLEVSDPSLLPSTEKALIEWFKPLLNFSRMTKPPDGTKLIPEKDKNGFTEVGKKRVARHIAFIRRDSGKTLSEFANDINYHWQTKVIDEQGITAIENGEITPETIRLIVPFFPLERNEKLEMKWLAVASEETPPIELELLLYGVINLPLEKQLYVLKTIADNLYIERLKHPSWSAYSPS